MTHETRPETSPKPWTKVRIAIVAVVAILFLGGLALMGHLMGPGLRSTAEQASTELSANPCGPEFIRHENGTVIFNGQIVPDVNKLRWREDHGRIVFYEGDIGQPNYVSHGYFQLGCK